MWGILEQGTDLNFVYILLSETNKMENWKTSKLSLQMQQAHCVIMYYIVHLWNCSKVYYIYSILVHRPPMCKMCRHSYLQHRLNIVLWVFLGVTHGGRNLVIQWEAGNPWELHQQHLCNPNGFFLNLLHVFPHLTVLFSQTKYWDNSSWSPASKFTQHYLLHILIVKESEVTKSQNCTCEVLGLKMFLSW